VDMQDTEEGKMSSVYHDLFKFSELKSRRVNFITEIRSSEKLGFGLNSEFPNCSRFDE